MFSVAYLFFFWIGWMKTDFDFGIFCFFIVADVLTIQLIAFGRRIYEKLKKMKG